MSVSAKKTKTSRRRALPKLTDAEWEIMRVVWDKQPCAAGTVQETLASSKDWAYSTVKTTMDRMAKKGLLKVKKIRNLQLFTSKVNKKRAARGEFRRMLNRAFGGALTPMMQYLLENEKLSKKDLGKLREMIKAAQNR